MRAGVIKERDCPLWYDVIVAFPPKDDDSHTGINHGPFVREILYPEDKIRAKFYQVYGTPRPLNMVRHSSVNNTPCARFIAKYQELEKQCYKSHDELFEATAEELTKEGFHLNKQGKRKGYSKQLSSTEVVSQTLASMFQRSMLNRQMDTVKTLPTSGEEEHH